MQKCCRAKARVLLLQMNYCYLSEATLGRERLNLCFPGGGCTGVLCAAGLVCGVLQKALLPRSFGGRAGRSVGLVQAGWHQRPGRQPFDNAKDIRPLLARTLRFQFHPPSQEISELLLEETCLVLQVAK